MAIQVPYSRYPDKYQAYEKAKTVITSDYISQWKIAVDLDWQDDYPKILASGSGFSMELHFEDDVCNVHLELSFMLKPFKNKIEQVLVKELEKKI
jgi:hypothetical protein